MNTDPGVRAGTPPLDHPERCLALVLRGLPDRLPARLGLVAGGVA